MAGSCNDEFGWASAGKMIYFIYSFFCHQLPQRSIFLFGELWNVSAKPNTSRTAKYIQPLVSSAIYRKRKYGLEGRLVRSYNFVLYRHLDIRSYLVMASEQNQAIPLWGELLLLLPIILDGGTHTISDLLALASAIQTFGLPN